jgi:hypothetical protein
VWGNVFLPSHSTFSDVEKMPSRVMSDGRREWCPQREVVGHIHKGCTYRDCVSNALASREVKRGLMLLIFLLLISDSSMDNSEITLKTDTTRMWFLRKFFFVS